MRRKADERTKLSFISAQWKKTVVIITFGKCLPCRPIPGIGAIFLIDLSGISKWSIPPPFYFPNEKRTFCSKLITELDIKLQAASCVIWHEIWKMHIIIQWLSLKI